MRLSSNLSDQIFLFQFLLWHLLVKLADVTTEAAAALVLVAANSAYVGHLIRVTHHVAPDGGCSVREVGTVGHIAVVVLDVLFFNFELFGFLRRLGRR